MRVFSSTLALCLVCALSAGSLSAADLTISLGIRETQTDGPAFDDGGSGGGIEWVNLDGQTLTADGTWQLFTFTPSVDTLTAFAGATADGSLDGEWGTIEHIRILNSDGITDPIRMWIDDVSNTDSGGTTTESFEGFLVGDEVMFQEPEFSGSTAGNVLDGSDSAAVTDSMANTGDQSYQVDWQFQDGTTTRWVRLTTFSTAVGLTLGNPEMHLQESAFSPTISFYAKAITIPEPSAIVLMTLAGLGLVAFRRRG